MRTLYVTPFDMKTKKCAGPSLSIHTDSLTLARNMFGGKPDSETPNTMIFNQPKGQALCVSWIRFAL